MGKKRFCCCFTFFVFSILPLSVTFAQEADLSFLRIGTGPPTGIFYEMGTAIAGSISAPPYQPKNCRPRNPCGVPGLVAVAQSRAGSIESLIDMFQGNLESAIVYADISRQFFEGDLALPHRGNAGELRMIASLATLDVHLIVRKDAEINGLEDLRGRRVGAGTPGSALPLQFSRFLEVRGLSLQDVVPVWGDFPEAVTQITEGQIDAIFTINATPGPLIDSVMATGLTKLLSIEDEIRNSLVAQEPFFYSANDIPAGSYENQPQPVKTMGLNIIWVVQNDVDSDTVYGMTRALWHEDTAKLLNLLYPGTSFVPPTRRLLRQAAVPIHSGAKRYYKEIKLIE